MTERAENRYDEFENDDLREVEGYAGEEPMDDKQTAAQLYALADDRNLASLLAWRCVMARCEADPSAFNGLLIGDIQHANQIIEWLKAEATKPVRRDPFG